MARNIDLAALRSFIAVAETGGVTRAAQRLHLTQSGVSMQLKRLEESLGIQLLAREGRGVSLTKIGEELLAQARRLVALNDEIWEKVTKTPTEGALTLGIPHDIVHPIAAQVLKRFANDFPGVRVSLVSHGSRELLRGLEAGEIDVILTTEQDVGQRGETLARRPMVWMGANGGRAWRRRPLPIAIEPNCAFRKPSFEALEQADIGFDWVISTANDHAICASIAADLAIGAFLRGAEPAGTEEIEHDGDLPALPMVNINLYSNTDQKDVLTDQLADYVRAAFQHRDPLRDTVLRHVA